MDNLLERFISEAEQKDFKEWIIFINARPEKIHLRNGVVTLFRHYCDENDKPEKFRTRSSVFGFLKQVQELFITEDYLALIHRPAMNRYRFYLVRGEGDFMEETSLADYLDLKDRFARDGRHDGRALKIDFMPFYDYTPTIKDIRSVGNGIRFLNRYMCSNIFSQPETWNTKLFNFLKLHQHNGQQLLVNGALIKDQATFYAELENLLDWLKTQNPEASSADVQTALNKAGFEAGWGDTVGRMIETMQTLLDLFNEPNDQTLEKFISRVPMPLISKIAIISPHGWFGQTNALGKPDTGGQVIYILDQVRALEKHLTDEIAKTGLNVVPKIIVLTRLIPDAEDTTCDQRMEKIYQTENGWILRVPFRDRQFNIVKRWVSRFKIWPYLENFAEDAATELISEFEGRPHLVIGNYSDGNLVASLLSDKFDVIQCTIAHALEKTKYAFSDLHWQEMETDYHFDVQYTADIFSMNKSDFIITSTLQEIIGTENTVGQYESYQFFSMPDLYQVQNGINLFAPKFNVIPPGVDENLYFPYTEEDKRLKSKRQFWEDRLFTLQSDDIFGQLDNTDKMPIFTMARLDIIKNITGLVKAYGLSARLQQDCNLVFAAGTIHQKESSDKEERDEIAKIYDLVERFNLYGKIRWLPSVNKLETGEVYRVIADHGGIFVQPALFEAFGLTVIEAMASGLPTFAPKFGGPLEIIEYGVSGFLLNTSRPDLIAGSLEHFVDECSRDEGFWKTISENGMRRVNEKFNWNNYSQRLINLSKLYGFWRYAVSGKGKEEMDRYCDMIYHFLIRQRAEAMR